MSNAWLPSIQRTGQHPRIFLNYSREDSQSVSILYERLQQVGCAPWMDIYDSVAGRRWSDDLDRMLHTSHFFLACLSTASLLRGGMVEQEQDVALDIQQIFPPDVSYIIPLKLDACTVPAKLNRFHWIDYFAPEGFTQLCNAIDQGVPQRFPVERRTISFHSSEEWNIVIPGTIALSIYPARGVPAAIRLYAGDPATFVHSHKLADLEKLLRKQLWSNGHTMFYAGEHHHRYDLVFVLPGGQIVSAADGIVVPAEWPFRGDEVRLGSDITAQFSLTFQNDSRLTMRKSSLPGPRQDRARCRRT